MSKKPARKLIFSTLDPQKRTVEFYDDTWSHIKGGILKLEAVRPGIVT